MSTKFSQFLPGGAPRNTDIVVGLRAGNNTQYTFSGVADSTGANIVTWYQSAGGANVNGFAMINAPTGITPAIAVIGADANIDLSLECQGDGSVFVNGTNAMFIPTGTTAQRPASPIQGFIRTNVDTGLLEFWDDLTSSWVGCAAVSSMFTWNSVQVNTQMVPNNGYYCVGGANLIFTLPAVCPAGQTMKIAGYLPTGWTIAQNTGQQILLGADSSTVGVSGGFSANTDPATDCVELLCVVANLTFASTSAIGNINIF